MEDWVLHRERSLCEIWSQIFKKKMKILKYLSIIKYWQLEKNVKSCACQTLFLAPQPQSKPCEDVLHKLSLHSMRSASLETEAQ